ncbi:MADCA protein, partial [Halcyon senegalensis]|nr:MADCA protein [Halcyon senegalensis]
SLNPTVSSLLCPGQPATRLVVTPQEPVVPYGGSVELNCSLACEEGTVQWKGLDTNLGSISSFPNHSILHISSAVVTMAGTKICQGTCNGQRYQTTVSLKVYALPDRLRLETEPSTLEPGQPGSLCCSAQGIYPLKNMGLTWYCGDKALPGTDPHTTESDEGLFDIMSKRSVAGEEVREGVEFRCEVTLKIGQETFTRVASVAVRTRAVTEQLVSVATSTGSSRIAAATTGSPSTASPVTTSVLPQEPRVPIHDPTTALTATHVSPDTNTILELATATKPPSTERSAPWDIITGSSTARLATTMLPGSSTVVAAGSIKWGSPPAEKGPEPDCSLRIWSLPPNGMRGRALRIECHARCTSNATVRWLQTPVALSQYREEVAGSTSTLWLDRAEPWHQGRYQCVLLGHRSQVVSLQLTVSEGKSWSVCPAIAVGTTASLLGLMVTSVVSYCLCKRYRSQYELP